MLRPPNRFRTDHEIRYPHRGKAQADLSPHQGRLAIAKAIAIEREHLLAVIGEALGEVRAEARKDAADQLHDEVRRLRMELLELQTTLCELRQVMAGADRGGSKTILDLPPILRSSRAN